MGAVSAGGFVRVGKPHAKACSGLLAAHAAQSGPDPCGQTRATGGSLQSHPTSAEGEKAKGRRKEKESKGERLATHRCLTDKSSTGLAQVDLIPHCEV